MLKQVQHDKKRAVISSNPRNLLFAFLSSVIPECLNRESSPLNLKQSRLACPELDSGKPLLQLFVISTRRVRNLS
jgi:hypothetical protein